MKALLYLIVATLVACGQPMKSRTAFIKVEKEPLWQKMFQFERSRLTLIEDHESKISTQGNSKILIRNCDNTLAEIDVKFTEVDPIANRVYFVELVRRNKLATKFKNLKTVACDVLSYEDHYAMYTFSRVDEEKLIIQIQLYNNSLRLVKIIEEESI